MKKIHLALLAAFALPGIALAQEQAGVYAITNGVIHTMGPEGVIKQGTVVIEGDRIVAVGENVDVPEGAVVIDAEGKVVTPGFMDPATNIGIVEVSAVDGTVDASTLSDRYTAAHSVADAVNPRSTLIPVNRIEGITRVVTRPYSGVSIFAGRSAVISLGSIDDYLIDRAAAMHLTLGISGAELTGGSRGAALVKLREALQDARDYGENRRAFESADRYAYSLSRPDLEALQPVLAGDLPLVVDVERASDIEAVLRLAEDFGLEVIIQGGSEAWLVAEQLAEADVPVILNPLQNLPFSFEQIASTLKNAAALHSAGVTIAFSQGESHNARNVKQAAGIAVANGLPWTAALEALTVNPAKIFGVENYGRLAPGFDADVVIWDGDPLEVTTFADRVFIQGRDIPMVSRQTLLRDRYMEDEARPQAYDRP
ncbi:MAG TPA: amidohydrolase family protein [Gammaproteobacteria bacterium]